MRDYDPQWFALTMASAMEGKDPVAIKEDDALFIKGVWETEYPRFPVPENIVAQYEEMKAKSFFLPFCAKVYKDIDLISKFGGEYYCNKYVAAACLALRNPAMQAEVLRYLSIKKDSDDDNIE